MCSWLYTFSANLYVHGSCSHVVVQLALHKKYKEIKGVKMFPTITSSDVGMVDCVSDATGSCTESQLMEKVQEQRGVFCDSVTTQSTFTALKRHSGYTFTICYIWQHFDAARLSVPVCFIDLNIF